MEQPTFAELLRKHMDTMRWGPDRLAKASGIHRSTIIGWRDRGKKPQFWQDIVRIAAALGLDDVQTDELIIAAQHPTLAQLLRSTLDDKERELLRQWEDVVRHRRAPEAEVVRDGTQVEDHADGVSAQASAFTDNQEERQTDAAEEEAKTRIARVRFWRLGGGIAAFLLLGVLIFALVQWQSRTLAVLSVASNTSVVPSVQTKPTGSLNVIDPLPEQGSHLPLRTAQGDIITSGGSVHSGEPITVLFTIRNDDTHPIKIKRMVAGVRPQSGCAKDASTKWGGPVMDFDAVVDITLQPGKTFEYRQSRSFFQLGTYFVEPAYMDEQGHWGGIWPFPCTDFVVTP